MINTLGDILSLIDLLVQRNRVIHQIGLGDELRLGQKEVAVRVLAKKEK